MAEDEGIELVMLPDLSALGKLDEMVHKGAITAAKATFTRQKYEELHGHLKNSINNTRKLFDDREEMSRKLQSEKEALEKVLAEAQEDETAMDLLREDSEQAESEALACRERELALQAEEADLRRAQEDFINKIQEIQREHDIALQPQLLQLRMDIGDLSSQNDDSAAKIEQIKKERDEIQVTIAKLLDDMRQLEIQKKIELELMSTFDGVPEKLRKQGDVLANGLKSLRSQEQNYIDKIKDSETQITNLHESRREITEEIAKAATELEKMRILAEQKEQAAAEMKKDLELQSLDADQYLADRVTLDMQLKALSTDLKMEQERLVTRSTERDKMLKKVKHTESVLKQIQDTLPSFLTMKDNINHQLGQVEHDRKKVHGLVLEVKKDIDLRMHQYSGLESFGKEVVATLHEGHRKAAALEKEVYRCIGLDYARQQQMGELATMRENICRVLSSKMHQWKEAKERMRVSDIVIGFLQKKEKDVRDAYNKFSNVYNLLRSQRNKSVKILQLSNLSITELKDKMSMLDVEVNMLQNEAIYKDRVLTKMRKEFAEIVQHRFLLRSELTECHIALQHKREVAEEHLIEISKLNSVLKSGEREMECFRKQYEQSVVSRNNTGISLIDRNDELCILYEKSHAQDELLKHSEIELLKRENEISLLKPQLISLERYILLCYKSLPNAFEIRKTIKELKDQLRMTVQEGERLSKLVENPENKSHWRLLEGSDPGAKELLAKLTALDHFLSCKGDQSLEKNLILEEVTALAEDLKKQAANGYAGSMEMMSKMSYYQRQLRNITQRMMATVSELSLSQATAISLKQQKDSFISILADANLRLLSGQPPTVDCEKEWLRIERQSVSAAAGTDKHQDSQIRRSTAEGRPNAYLPEEKYGLPKPFGGAHPPFKPSELGTSFRHIRKPHPRPLPE